MYPELDGLHERLQIRQRCALLVFEILSDHNRKEETEKVQQEAEQEEAAIVIQVRTADGVTTGAGEED